ncbi:MAG: T9SS type A sorting domain-containing protein [Crocinitomicaceae bacterium]|nr:T9SS type A sorting domain-containing protein [Crocinitomicaceae bacterium]
MNLLDDENSSKDISNASSSVLMMLTDNGQRMATAVMVNNSKFDGTIYAFTSSSALLGDPAAFVFVVDLVIGNCSSVSVCWDKALSGASLIKTDPVSGITLLQLAGRPRKQWKTYLSGWDISDHAGSGFFSITHGLTRPQQLSVYAGSLLSSTWKEVPTVDCSPWESGGIFQGAVGGPLFNSKGQIVGIYTGGAPACGESSHDHFALLSLSWNSFRPYLDPFVTPSSKLLGSSPQYGNEEGTQKKELIVLYPNPAYDRIIIQNNSTEEIVEVVIYDNTGRVLLHTTDFFPWLDLKGLSSGHYFLRVVQPSGFSMEQFIVR